MLKLYRSSGYNNRIVILQCAPIMLSSLQAPRKEHFFRSSSLLEISVLIHLFPSLKKLFNIWSVLNLWVESFFPYAANEIGAFSKTDTITSFTQFTPICRVVLNIQQTHIGLHMCWVLHPLQLGDHPTDVHVPTRPVHSRSVQTHTEPCRARPDPTLSIPFPHSLINPNSIFFFFSLPASFLLPRCCWNVWQYSSQAPEFEARSEPHSLVHSGRTPRKRQAKSTWCQRRLCMYILPSTCFI